MKEKTLKILVMILLAVNIITTIVIAIHLDNKIDTVSTLNHMDNTYTRIRLTDSIFDINERLEELE